MNYQQYFPLDVVNGPGTRCTLFVSGCEHQCRGCYNQSTWNPCSGHEFDSDMVAQIISDLKDTRVKRRGLSLSGGDPLFPANVPAVLALVKLVKRECPDKDIWLWSGYLLEELSAEQSKILDYIDVLVDGKFEQQLADPSLQFRGSSNQVIHHLKQ
ncbi:anaerobic ribonucleoside-triphosphate reductase-activating protein [Shewanella colwelliana]|uniref:anaerobic ribonucleoside-triphosphate reductase-activating protein n=1 Tax=Shewanella colwelliana TaxID=23 RepID=UPI0022AFFF94|nr:anaerobic ribonucleoside-triphosphate reductase-activating protein [Shewanella colwelliana]MCZ4338738.1 anaerobic ribonucleoside-triphosphate reductase-activating protein [Shewanella colwelliana]